LLLLWFLPAGVLGLNSAKRWMLFAVFPLFVAFYALSKMFAIQYALLNVVALIPLAIFGMLSLARAIEQAAPRIGSAAQTIGVVVLLGISLTMLPQIHPAGISEQYGAPTLSAVESTLATIRGRAVVFFTYRTGDNVHEEPVFNIELADIDSQRIIRAHDLGSLENIKLYNYYRTGQPDRRFFRFDRKSRQLTPIDPPAEYEAAGAR
jgi:hypothetical protein